MSDKLVCPECGYDDFTKSACFSVDFEKDDEGVIVENIWEEYDIRYRCRRCNRMCEKGELEECEEE